MGRKLVSRLSFGKREKQVGVWQAVRAAPLSDGSMGARQGRLCSLPLPVVHHSSTGMCAPEVGHRSSGRQHQQLGPTPLYCRSTAVIDMNHKQVLCPAGGPDSKGEGRLQRSGDLRRVNTCQIHTITCRGGALPYPSCSFPHGQAGFAIDSYQH